MFCKARRKTRHLQPFKMEHMMIVSLLMLMRSSSWKTKWAISARKWGISPLVRSASEVSWVKGQILMNPLDSVGKRIASCNDQRNSKRATKWETPRTHKSTGAFTFPVPLMALRPRKWELIKLLIFAKERTLNPIRSRWSLKLKIKALEETVSLDHLHPILKRSRLTLILVRSPKCNYRWSKGRS